MRPLDEIRLLEEAARQSRVRRKDFGKVLIKATGTKLYHGLGTVPKIISIHPVDLVLVGGSMPTYVLDPAPSSKYISIKSSIDAHFLIYVAGGL